MNTIIGIDCATQPEKVGLALAHMEADILVVDEVATGSKRLSPIEIVNEWVNKSENVLLALDAPLGWPEALGCSLIKHCAGQAMSSQADDLFHRHTDNEIFNRLGKRPLEVGANLIARTAEAALRLLQDLRQRTGCEIPLAWNASDVAGISAIEVYPAATLMAHGRKKEKDCIALFSTDLRLPETIQLKSDHEIDAVLCAISGADFLKGKCVEPAPKDRERVSKEGWIWAPSLSSR